MAQSNLELKETLAGGCVFRYVICGVMGAKSLITILIVLAFGFSLIAESFSSDLNHHATQTENQLIQDSQLSADQPILTSHHSEPTDTKKDDCSDPCHLGHCHWGHCSFTAVNQSFSLASADNSQSYFGSLNIFIAAPFLEGPRRPPRLA